MNSVTPLPGMQLRLIVDNTRNPDDDRLSDRMTQDEYASVLTAIHGRLIEPHQIGGWDGAA